MESSEKKRLLLVDDNRPFADLVQQAFGDEFEVIVAEDGQAGLIECAGKHPDVVLLDVNMPSMNGIEFLRQMSLHEEIARIPVIVVTASDYNGITESLAKRYHNLSAFMTKLSPVDVIREKILRAFTQ